MCAYNQVLKLFHVYFIQKQLSFYHTLKKKNQLMVSQQVCDYPLEFDQNFKTTTKINLFI